MFRISDILNKKNKDDKGKPPEPSEKPQAQESKGAEEGSKGVSIYSAVTPESRKENAIDAKELYQALLAKAKEVYSPNYKFPTGFLIELAGLTESAIELLNLKKESLLAFCFEDYPNTVDYLFHHSANVCIISLEVGRALHYERTALIELGISAFIHDIGMVKYLDLINKTEVLSDEDFKKIKGHSQAGFELLKNAPESVPPIIMEAVLREHERIDGSGYPDGLRGDQIPAYAKVIGLTDMYEAQVHPRSFRRKFTPIEALKEMITYKTAFEPKIIKTLINCIGVFPIGTIVRLNTKEIGVVVNDNLDSPFRPMVNIKYDVDGKELQEPKIVDLSRNTVIYIEQSLISFSEKPQNGKR